MVGFWRPSLGCGLCVVFLVAPAAAGAATIRLKPSAPPDPHVGAVWAVEAVVTRDAGEAAGAATLVITLSNDTTGERLDVTAQQTRPDVYTAKIAFPTEGAWRYRAASGNAAVASATAIQVGGAEAGGSGWKLVAIAAGAIAAALAGLLLRRGRRRTVPTRDRERPIVDPVPPRSPPAPSDDARNDRDALIRSCVYLYDIVREPVLRDRLRDALAEAGVSELDNVSGRFDPSKHRATGRISTDNPSLEGQIAEVERTGFTDRGRVVRLPEVTVYSADRREPSG